jgi:hypothetical protein
MLWLIARLQGPPLTIADSNLTRNTAAGEHGGAVNAISVPLTLRSSNLKQNKAAQLGGAVYATAAPALVLTNCSVIDNAASSGGAVWAEGAGLVQVRRPLCEGCGVVFGLPDGCCSGVRKWCPPR